MANERSRDVGPERLPLSVKLFLDSVSGEISGHRDLAVPLVVRLAEDQHPLAEQAVSSVARADPRPEVDPGASYGPCSHEAANGTEGLKSWRRGKRPRGGISVVSSKQLRAGPLQPTAQTGAAEARRDLTCPQAVHRHSMGPSAWENAAHTPASRSLVMETGSLLANELGPEPGRLGI